MKNKVPPILPDCADTILCIDDKQDYDFGNWLADNVATTQFYQVRTHDDGASYAMCYWTSLTETSASRKGVEGEDPLEPWCKSCHLRILLTKLKEGYLES